MSDIFLNRSDIFRIISDIFFLCSHLPFCTPRDKDTKTCEKSEAFYTPQKMNIRRCFSCVATAVLCHCGKFRT